MMDYATAVNRFLLAERESATRARPPITPALFVWRGQTYLGGIQDSLTAVTAGVWINEIVYVSKTSRPAPEPFLVALREAMPDRLALSVEDTIDFEGRGHILRRVGDRLMILTPEQTAFMLDVQPEVRETNPVLGPPMRIRFTPPRTDV